MLARKDWIAGGCTGLCREARGLCRACYRRCARDGTLKDYPTFYWPPLDYAAVVERYEQLKTTDVSMREIARRIGISPNTLYVVLRNAGYHHPGTHRQGEIVPSPLPEEEVLRLRRLVGIA